MNGSLARIPVSEPRLAEDDIAAATDALRSGWISSSGRYIEEFETRWASYCGREHGIAVSSGTTALELAIEALDLHPGDEVIIPTFTIVSCVLAVLRAGATPVLVDADPRTWCLDVDQAAACVTSRTRAIMPVHIYGHPVDMDPLLALAEARGLAIVEDAAEAHGAEYLSRRGPVPEWRPAGSFGASSTFSFYANKLIATGEGGMILTDDAATAGRLRSARNLAFVPERRFLHRTLGHNYRLTNVQAALGVTQVARMPELLVRRRWLGAAYEERLRGVDCLELQATQEWARHSHWMFGIVVCDESPLDAVELAERLARRGIETRPFFLGMHEQPALRARGLFAAAKHPVAERLARRGLYLPSGVGLTEIQLERVCDAVRAELR